MKLLYISNARLPTERAYGLQIMKTCEALAEAGVDLELVIPLRINHLAADPFAYYGIRPSFKVATLEAPDFVRSGPLGFLVSALWFSEKVRWLPAFRGADVIYSRDALVLAQYLLLGKRLVFEAHARPSFVSKIVARRALRTVVISEGLRTAYAAAGVAPERIVVAPDAVDERLFDGVPDRAAARGALGFPRDKRIVLYAGHLYPRKGAAALAEAAALVPDALFIFLGGTPEDIEAFGGKWGSRVNVRIIGHVPHEGVPVYLRAADILVLPNSGKDEDSTRFTSPMKLFEYIASGTPIVASDLPSIREVLAGDSAYLVPPDDPEALAAGIRDALADSQAARDKSVKALSLAASHTWAARARRIIAALKDKDP